MATRARRSRSGSGGFAGSIAVIGEEPELPYERPPLSKDYLAGDRAWERLLIRPAASWAERDVAMLTGRRVVAVDPAARRDGGGRRGVRPWRVGLRDGDARRPRDPATRSFSIVYLRDGRVVALDCVNAIRDFVVGRALVTRRAAMDPARLADPAAPLKDLA